MSAAVETVSNEEMDVAKSIDQYLTFMLAGEEYGVDILSVQEIKGWEGVTPMPNTPDYILGIINLRGTIVPIMDLRKRFRLDAMEFDATTVVIVVKVQVKDQIRTMGMVVDAVSEVYNVSNTEMSPPPDFGCVVDMDFVKCLASIEEKLIILLDLALIVEAELLDILNRAEAQA